MRASCSQRLDELLVDVRDLRDQVHHLTAIVGEDTAARADTKQPKKKHKKKKRRKSRRRVTTEALGRLTLVRSLSFDASEE